MTRTRVSTQARGQRTTKPGFLRNPVSQRPQAATFAKFLTFDSARERGWGKKPGFLRNPVSCDKESAVDLDLPGTALFPAGEFHRQDAIAVVRFDSARVDR